jgi:sortase system peptidoglycan-associated protein
MKNIKGLNFKKSKNALLATLVLAAITSISVSANGNEVENTLTGTDKRQAQTNNENIGFGTGALIGGIAAGPIGAMVAGVGGAFIAKFINIKDENEELNTALTHEQQANEQVQKQYQSKLQRLESSYQQQLVTMENQQQGTGQLQAGLLQAETLLMSLQFSTGSSDIAAHYQEQVAALAQILNSSPTMKIDLSGYTDLTGEESLNQTLSKARVETVKTLLMAQGVKEHQIATFAFGEGAPVVANNEHEVSFYDRRVVMKLHKPSVMKNTEIINNQMAKNN